jgi:hypothetical protein
MYGSYEEDEHEHGCRYEEERFIDHFHAVKEC